MEKHDELRRVALQVLSKNGLDVHRRFGFGQYTLYATLRQEAAGDWNGHDFMQVMWRLVAEQLVFIDFYQSEPGNWSWHLTTRGEQVVASGTYDPADPDGYLRRLHTIAELDPGIVVYAREALLSFEGKCFLASTVMLGVASEAAFDALVGAFEGWSGLSAEEARRFAEAINGKQYATRFDAFRRRLEPKRNDLPDDLASGLELILNGVLELLRLNRNAAGHPTGRQIDETTAYTSLQLFEGYLRRLYALKSFFEASRRALVS